MLFITQENYLNKSDTDVELEILFIASPIKLETVKTSIFLALLTLIWLSIVSVITKFLIFVFVNFHFFPINLSLASFESLDFFINSII